jgi:transcriptional regulator with XRE-family HTH domain
MTAACHDGPVEQRERLGRRIADLRAKAGWTQQQLAERIAVSRVAVSHLESGLSHPGERTVALLAGVFKVEPPALVADTDYPEAKAERLPATVARHTELELQMALCEADLAWIERAGAPGADQVLAQWEVRLRRMAQDAGPAGDGAVEDLAARVRRIVDGRIADVHER